MRIKRNQGDPRRIGVASAVLALLIFLLASFVCRSSAQEKKTEEEPRALYNVRVPMRDGVQLSADIYFPKATGRLPVILNRTPYDNSWSSIIASAKHWASMGYVYVAQDCRGRYDSDGGWDPFFHEGDDGRDTLKWIVQQPWSNGKVGMLGSSYGGWVQWWAAPDAGDSLTAMAPMASPPDPFLNVPYINGVLTFGMSNWALLMDGHTDQSFGEDIRNYDKVAIRLYQADKNAWRLPVLNYDEFCGRSISWWKEWVRHSTYDSYWKRLAYQDKYNRISAPAFNITGWYDVQLIGAMMNYPGMVKQGKTPTARKQKLLIGPWGHAMNAKLTGRDFGDQAVIDLDAVLNRWFGYWLKGENTGILDEAPIRLFVMGTNRWQDEHEWPLARTQWTSYYLHSGGNANGQASDGQLSTEKPAREKPDRYDYDPANPVLNQAKDTYAGIGSESLVFPGDIHEIEERRDVLVYETPALQEDAELIGPVTLKLYASSSAPDTDWVGRLTDVSPDGTSWALCGTILRAKFRDSLENPTPLEPGKIYEYTLQFWPTANHFFKGHRIRIDVTSSAFPTFDRNLNTGQDSGISTTMAIAHQVIYHDAVHPSNVVLPMIPITR